MSVKFKSFVLSMLWIWKLISDFLSKRTMNYCSGYFCLGYVRIFQQWQSCQNMFKNQQHFWKMKGFFERISFLQRMWDLLHMHIHTKKYHRGDVLKNYWILAPAAPLLSHAFVLLYTLCFYHSRIMSVTEFSCKDTGVFQCSSKRCKSKEQKCAQCKEEFSFEFIA